MLWGPCCPVRMCDYALKNRIVVECFFMYDKFMKQYTIPAGYDKTRCPSTQSFPQFHAPLPWRHNGHDRVSNHQSHNCFLHRLFKAQIKENIKGFAPLVFVRGIHRSAVNSPRKGPVTRKMFPFHDVIMNLTASRPGLCGSPTKIQPSASISYSLGHFVPSGNTVRRHYNAVNFLPNPHKKTPRSSLVRARYEV